MLISKECRAVLEGIQVLIEGERVSSSYTSLNILISIHEDDENELELFIEFIDDKIKYSTVFSGGDLDTVFLLR